VTWKILLSAVALILIHLVVLGAGLLAPYDPAEQHRELPYLPPMRVHFVDNTGALHLRPFVYPSTSDAAGRYLEQTDRVCPLRFFVTSRNPGSSPRVRLFGVDSPGYIFILGTDEFGRDQLSRLIYGGRISLFSGLLALAISLALGLMFGGAAGYFGSWLDPTIMRTAEIFMALPWLFLLLAVRAFLPLYLAPSQAFFLLVAIVGLTGWARPARLIRGITLSAKQRDYVRAARAFGGSPFYLLRRHVLPDAAAVALTQAALLAPQYILAEVTLSFFGLGIGEPVPSWGNMLASVQQYYVLQSCWWMFAPGFALIPVFLLYYWLADGLQTHLSSGA
jgi:peptide/nickel transport system permease protein